MKLYIGNATKQVQNFTYRLGSGVRSQMIPIGAQVPISGDLDEGDVLSIIGQHEKYGLVEFDRIDQTKQFTGLVYSIDAPLRPDAIEKLMRHNTNVLVARGRVLRSAAALVEENRISQQLADNDFSPLRKFEMSVVEENPQPNADGIEPIGEGYRIQREAAA